MQSFTQGLQTLKSPPVMLVAMGGTFYEGATYTFVFMWVPVMIGLVGASTASCRFFGIIGCSFTVLKLTPAVIEQVHHLRYPQAWSLLALCCASPWADSFSRSLSRPKCSQSTSR